jgi:hypothetical protein
MAGDVITIQLGFDGLGLRDEDLFDKGTGQKLLDDQKLVLLPILLVETVEI